MYMCNNQSKQQNTNERKLYQNLDMNYSMIGQPAFVHNASYSGNIHYNVYPSHPMCDNIIVNNDRIRARQEDEWAIEQFLQESDSHVPPMINKRRDSFNIATVKNALVTVAKLNKKLETICAELKNNVDLLETQWQEKISICNAIKRDICQILQNTNNADFLNKVKKNLEKRKKKRVRERHRREQWKEEKLKKTEQRARLHAQADIWIGKERAVIEREKQEENLRKDADLILSDVRSKRNDVRKYLGILQELQNLRKVKMNVARARGDTLSLAADGAFDNATVKLIEQWTIWDREYSKEEQDLKFMLKTNNEKRTEKETENLFNDWENVLFGRSISIAEGYRKDLNSFIMIRTAWDKCISSENDATTIPIGWIVPEKPSSAAWQKCLVNIS